MLLDPSPDQEFFRETTARFLAEKVPPDEVRRLRDDPNGFAPDYWRAGAELGWTGLLVDEDLGGGSLSGLGLVDLTLTAHEFGRRAAPGPLCPTNVVAEMLGRYGHDHRETLSSLVAGRATAAWCVDEPRTGSRTAAAPVDIRIDGDEVVVNGTKRPVEAGGTADVLLVTGRTGQGATNALVPRQAGGVTVTPLRSIDVTRRYAAIDFDEVRLPLTSLVGEAGGGADDATRARRTAIVVSCAESVGALQAVFDLTVAWAFDRYSFGRPLASYQELKHRFADMKTSLEGSHAIADRAAGAVATASSDADELVCAAKAYIGQYGSELVQDCIQIHGGIGVTYEHDLHLYARRAAANRSGFGTPAEHRARLADIVELREAS
ncbi:acyl-CoA dehydrogenase family protein [Rhodococcus sp. B50]|uniref:acyl-CoA dehydrogenase family protein n=1 Tax=Rhodococcus sp. B50 TaxID=2682847 RepID=UPI001BD6C2C4|nr:acyl-CoA dehydrogenase [Rhodococcus sp. B50]MBS9371770.1 Acryloyl-CoA reductase (NADH) [Rhodococcus sp. B50]